MSIKWPRRRLLAMVGIASAFAGAVFPELNVKAFAETNVEKPNLAWSQLKLVDAQEIAGPDLIFLEKELQSVPDISNCGGPLDFSKAEFKAVQHRVANSSNYFLAAVWFFPSTRHAVIYWKLDEAIDNIKTRGFLYQFDTKGENAELVSASINKLPLRRTPKSTHSNQVAPTAPCNDWWSSCSDNPKCTCSGYRYTAPICGGINIGYIAGCCGACVFAGSLAGICLLVFCPICVVASACSSVTGTAYCCSSGLN